MKHIVLDFDDFSVLNNRLDLLLELKSHFPKLKVSLFTIPMAPSELSIMKIDRDSALKQIKENLDWLQLIPHGLTHMQDEFKYADKTTTLLALKGIEEAFNRDDLPFERGFKPPYWLWNQQVVDVLNERGWWGAIDRNNPWMIKTKKYYEYSHSADVPFWASDEELFKLHGHVDGMSRNDIEKCFPNLMKMPVDAEFHFVTEYLNEQD